MSEQQAMPAEPQQSYFSRIEDICNMRTDAQAMHDEFPDDMCAAMAKLAKDSGKKFFEVERDVDTETPEVIRRNREDDEDRYGWMDLAP
jgi:hypothetical protein